MKNQHRYDDDGRGDCVVCGEGIAHPIHNVDAQIDRLARYIMTNFPEEIGKGDPHLGEGAVDVAIQLLEQLRGIRFVPQQEPAELGSGE